MGVSFWSVIRDIYIRPVVSGVIALLAVGGFHQVLPAVPALAEIRYLIPLKLVVDVAIFLPVYMVLLVAFRQVSIIDWNNFQWFMAFGLEFLRHPLRERVKIYR
jgi:hypothetical protein